MTNELIIAMGHTYLPEVKIIMVDNQITIKVVREGYHTDRYGKRCEKIDYQQFTIV
jgi:hypothetical protein